MKKNSSIELYQKYFSLENELIEIVLKDNTVIVGKFCCFFIKDSDFGDNTIIKWQVIDKDCLSSIDDEGKYNGIFIWHKDIAKVKFYDDNSIMIF